MPATALLAKALIANLLMIVLMAAVIFLAAGTAAYWQAWLYLVTFTACAIAITVDLARRDPELLRRRMRGGPFAEARGAQRKIMAGLSLLWFALLIVPALDRRLGWSTVPDLAAIAGDVAVAAGFAVVGAVFRVNSHTAATIRVAEGQSLVTTGPYALVRHPMYAAALPLFFGTPLALGSWWGMAVAAAMLPFLAWRIRDEEAMLESELAGYAAYRKTTRFRLVPGVW